MTLGNLSTACGRPTCRAGGAPSDERTVALECRPALQPPGAACATMPRWVTNPLPTSPRAPYCRDVTAEKVGTVIGIVGATAAKATKPG
jgi:hypothetical protein